ncbi:MAG: undecaprenyldiphospho-muramoylpentapeptide beta-N-acetylglucosaminyltransferase [Magnetovibrionaceae bacterium]
MKPLVILAAGGTGGHVFPAEALAAALLARGYRLGLITDMRGEAYGGTLGDITNWRVRAGGILGRGTLAKARALIDLMIGTLQARGILKAEQPACVVGFGGYASVPGMWAATQLGIPAVVHEQNAVLGRANRLLAARVGAIATSFDHVEGVPPEAVKLVETCGMPVRTAIQQARGEAYASPQESGRFRLLVLGGSQGARVFSDVIPEAVKRLPRGHLERLELTQQCRPEDLERTRAAYDGLGVNADLASFFDDVPARLNRAHLVIARAGASTMAELTTLGRPAILVPYPFAADDHQSANAHALDDVGGGWLIESDHFSPETLCARLQSLMETPATLEKAAACAAAAGKPEAAENLADLVERMTGADRGETPKEKTETD